MDYFGHSFHKLKVALQLRWTRLILVFSTVRC